MCEVDVSCLIDGSADPFTLSHSRAEAGEANKWSDALAIAEGRALPGLDITEAKQWAGEFGAWEREDIAAWTDTEVVALVLQYAAGDLRELQELAPGDGLGDIDWTEAEALAEAGTCGGNLFPHDGRLFVYIGS